MVEQRVDGFFTAVDHGHDTPLGSPACSISSTMRLIVIGVFSRRFEHKAVAAGDSVGQKPQRHHAGKVERRDRRHDADRLADHMLVDAAGDIFDVGALHQRGNAAGHLDVLDRAAQLGLGLGQRFAAFVGGDARDLVDMLFQQILELEHILNSIGRRRASPAVPRGMRRLHGAIDLVARCHGYAHNAVGRRRIMNIQPLGCLRALPVPAYIVKQLSVFNHRISPRK